MAKYEVRDCGMNGVVCLRGDKELLIADGTQNALAAAVVFAGLCEIADAIRDRFAEDED